MVADTGDWRRSRIPSRSAEFARPLLPVIGADRAKLPESGSLLRIDADDVRLEALKLAGNPTPEGSSARPGRQAVLRLVESRGHPPTWSSDQVWDRSYRWPGPACWKTIRARSTPSVCTASKSRRCWPNSM